MFDMLKVARLWVIARIEAMLERIVDGLLHESEALTITLKSRTGLSRLSRRRANASDINGQVPAPKQRDLNFPGATTQEAWNFS
jgi:meiotic recombination protein SPO11